MFFGMVVPRLHDIASFAAHRRDAQSLTLLRFRFAYRRSIWRSRVHSANPPRSSEVRGNPVKKGKAFKTVEPPLLVLISPPENRIIEVLFEPTAPGKYESQLRNLREKGSRY
jgi:hypothetical protein